MDKTNPDVSIIKKHYEKADFGFCIFDSKVQIIYCNTRFADMAGLPVEDVQGKSLKDLFTDKSMHGGIEYAIENQGVLYECRFSNGEYDKTIFNMHFDRYDDAHSMVYIYDETENYRLKRELMIAEKRIAAAQKVADIGRWEYDYKTDRFDLSEKTKEIFGTPNLRENEEFAKILDRFQEAENVKKYFTEFIAGDKEYDTVYKLKALNGVGERTIYSYGNIYRDSSGEPIRAVGYAKDITDWINTEKKMRHDEKLIDTYLNFVGTVIIMLDGKGKVTFLNKKGAEVLGYDMGELQGKAWVEQVIPPEDRKRISDVLRDIYEQKESNWDTYENPIVRKTGEIRIIRWNNAAIKDETGRITGTISSGEDITDIRRNEERLAENEKSLKEAEAKARMGHWIRKPAEKELYWSDGLYRMFGYEPGEIKPSVEKALEMIHEDNLEEFTAAINKAVDSGEPYNIQVKACDKEGNLIHIRVESDIETNEEGKVEKVKGVVTDITETYHRIAQLEETRNRLNLSESMSHTGHWQRNLKEDTYIFSDELYRIFGIDDGIELITHDLLHERFHPEDRKRIQEYTEEKLKNGEEYSFEARIIRPDGKLIHVEASARIENDSSGKPSKANGFMRDITELRNHENLLEQREMQLSRAEEIAGAGNWIMDLNTGKYVCSDNFFRICGIDPDSSEATYENIMKATHPDDLDRIDEIIKKSMETGSDYEFENRLLMHDGKIKHVRSKGTYIKDSKGIPVQSVGTLLDITEYKKTEERLTRSRKRLEKAEEIAHVGHWERDFISGKSYWSDEIYRILGHEPQSFEASETIYKKFIHPDDFEEFMENSRRAHQGEIPYVFEARLFDKNGKLKHIRTRGNIVKEKSRVIKTFGALEDITESKLREEELLEKNRLLDEAEAVAHVGHFINDYSNGTRYWSDEMYRILGYEPQTEIDKGSLYKSLMEPDEFMKSVEGMNEAIRKRKKTHESSFTIKDAYGNNKHLKHLYRFNYINEKHVASFGVVQDITEVKTHYEDMEYMNYHDALTDLYNRRYFDEIFSEMDSRENYPLSVIVADINGLKMTNDTIGHAAGDRLIMKTARVLRSVSEEGDILARIGGDDFILLMPVTTQSQAEIIMNRLHELFAEANEDMPISVSMGLSVKLKADKSKEDFIKEAEDNMYTSKLYEKTSKRGDLLRLIMDTLYERSSREEKHSERVSKYCGEMAKALKMPQHKVNELTALGLLHDIGKIAIKDSVLNKPDKLDEEEWVEIRRHSETGYRILSQSPGMLQASKYVLAHHERWDGKGYPNGIKSYEIPTQARIIAICDAFDAMRSKRPYREPISIKEAVSEIRKGAGTQFDPELAKVFVVQVIGEKW